MLLFTLLVDLTAHTGSGLVHREVVVYMKVAAACFFSVFLFFVFFWGGGGGGRGESKGLILAYKYNNIIIHDCNIK